MQLEASKIPQYQQNRDSTWEKGQKVCTRRVQESCRKRKQQGYADCAKAGHTRPFCPDRDKVNSKYCLAGKTNFIRTKQRYYNEKVYIIINYLFCTQVGLQTTS
jgi:hypothetical protein